MQLIREVLAKIETAVVGKNGDALPEVGKDEKVLGTLPDELQRFYVVMDGMMAEERVKLRELLEKVKEAKKGPKQDPCQCPVCSGALDSLKDRMETVSNLFWGAVRRAVPGAMKANGIELRKGFQVVTCPAQEPEAEVIAMRIPLSGDLAKILNLR